MSKRPLPPSIPSLSSLRLLPCPSCKSPEPHQKDLCPLLLNLYQYDRELLELQKAGIVPLSQKPLLLRPLKKIPTDRKEVPKETKGSALMKSVRERSLSQSLLRRSRPSRSEELPLLGQGTFGTPQRPTSELLSLPSISRTGSVKEGALSPSHPKKTILDGPGSDTLADPARSRSMTAATTCSPPNTSNSDTVAKTPPFGELWDMESLTTGTNSSQHHVTETSTSRMLMTTTSTSLAERTLSRLGDGASGPPSSEISELRLTSNDGGIRTSPKGRFSKKLKSFESKPTGSRQYSDELKSKASKPPERKTMPPTDFVRPECAQGSSSALELTPTPSCHPERSLIGS